MGEATTETDRNCKVHTYTRDMLVRIAVNAVTTLGSAMNGSMRRIEYANDGQRLRLPTSTRYLYHSVHLISLKQCTHPGARWRAVAHRGRTSADERLAAELAAGKTVRDAATAVGLSERTAHRRLTDPDFQERVTDLRSAMVRTAAGRLADGMTEAAEVLRALLTHLNPQVRHRAAVKVLELGQKVIDLTELEERLKQLEQLVNRERSV